MPSAFITGATGFIGRNLIDELTERGWSMTALYRQEKDAALLESLGVMPVMGDLTDAASMRAAIPDKTDYCFHVAADTSPWRGHRDRQKAVNVDGTRNIILACFDKRVGRLVHVSTIAVYGTHPGEISEETPQLGYGSWVGYVHTKSQAERRVREAVNRGLDAVICNPGHILGRYNATSWAGMFMLVQRNELPGIPPGKGCFANGREVARGLVEAALHGKKGENYLMGGPYASFKEVVGEIGRLLGKDDLPRTIPAVAIKSMARLQQWKGLVTGKPPKMSPEAAYFVCKDEKINSSKAERELGYRTIPLSQSLEECYDWLISQGLLEPRPDGVKVNTPSGV